MEMVPTTSLTAAITVGGNIASYDSLAHKWMDQGHSWKTPGFKQQPESPVCGINRTDAKSFCAWLTTIERDSGVITKEQRYRLPTDAEWSLAVGLQNEKPGTPEEKDSKITHIYSWGTQWPPPSGAGNYAGGEALLKGRAIATYDDGYPRTSPVGSFPPNALGLFDMGGNLWQWCEDWHNQKNQLGTLRGASWSNAERHQLYLSYRSHTQPGSRWDTIGFRVVLDKNKAPQ
jgi:formylglycine-generating enzyme required for sulfatase activity